MKIKCIKNVVMKGTKKTAFINGVIYDAEWEDSDNLSTCDEQTDLHTISGPLTPFFKKHFVIVDEIWDAYDRAMSII